MSVKTVSIRVDEDAYNRIVRVQKEMKKENEEKRIAGNVSMADVIRKMDNDRTTFYKGYTPTSGSELLRKTMELRNVDKDDKP